MGTLSFTCPMCGCRKDYPIDDLVEGALLECPRCTIKLKLHGHMWRDVQEQINNIRNSQSDAP